MNRESSTSPEGRTRPVRASILVIDDEPAITTMLAAMLLKAGHQPTVINDPAKVLSMDLSHVDLVLVDVMMPGLDGIELVRRVRDRVDCPILFLTAKTGERDAVIGYGSGGDDYIRKPFGKAELIAKINAHLTRERHQYHDALVLGRYRFDLAGHALSYDGEPVPLTTTEYAICEYLATYRSSIQSCSSLTDMLYEMSPGATPDVCARQIVPVHISNARMKFKRFGVNPIRTVRSIGYQWTGC